MSQPIVTQRLEPVDAGLCLFILSGSKLHSVQVPPAQINAFT